MATVLEEYTIEERRSVVLFFVGRRTQWIEYPYKIFPVYGGKCLSRKPVHNWVEKFSQGRSKVADDTSSPCSDCDRSNYAAGGSVESS
jgi:hypothetical protein